MKEKSKWNIINGFIIKSKDKMGKIEIILIGILVCVVLQFTFDWNMNRPSLFLLGWTQIGLYFSVCQLFKLRGLTENTQEKR